jgi:hypothetical protein
MLGTENLCLNQKKLDLKIVEQYLVKSFGHILKANDVKHHISQIQPDLMILKAPKREMKYGFSLTANYMVKNRVFMSRL